MKVELSSILHSAHSDTVVETLRRRKSIIVGPECEMNGVCAQCHLLPRRVRSKPFSNGIPIELTETASWKVRKLSDADAFFVEQLVASARCIAESAGI